MDPSLRGAKHACPECQTKYYDLKRPDHVCPRCGAKPAEPKPRRGRGARTAVKAR